MRSGVSHVKEEWLIMLTGFLEIGDGVFGNRIGQVKAFPGLYRRVVARKGGRIVVTADATDEPKELVETALQRPVGLTLLEGGDMPLADHVGAIAKQTQEFRDGDAAPVEEPLIGGFAEI